MYMINFLRRYKPLYHIACITNNVLRSLTIPSHGASKIRIAYDKKAHNFQTIKDILV